MRCDVMSSAITRSASEYYLVKKSATCRLQRDGGSMQLTSPGQCRALRLTRLCLREFMLRRISLDCLRQRHDSFVAAGMAEKSFSDSPLGTKSRPFLALVQPPTSPTLPIHALAPKPLGMEIVNCTRGSETFLAELCMHVVSLSVCLPGCLDAFRVAPHTLMFIHAFPIQGSPKP